MDKNNKKNITWSLRGKQSALTKGLLMYPVSTDLSLVLTGQF